MAKRSIFRRDAGHMYALRYGVLREYRTGVGFTCAALTGIGGKMHYYSGFFSFSNLLLYLHINEAD